MSWQNLQRTVVWGAAVLVAARVTGAREYTLDELVSESMRTSRKVKKIESELVKTEEQIWEAKGGAFPKLSASVNYQYAWEQYNPLALEAEMPSFPATVDGAHGMYQQLYGFPAPLDAGDTALAYYLDGVFAGFAAMTDVEIPKNTFNMALTLEQPLFAQGKVTVGLRIARAHRQSILCKYDAARQQVKADATKLFYGALLAKRNLEIRRAAVGLSEEVHRLTILRQTVGTGSVIDTLSSRVELEKARMELRKARGDLRSAYDAMIKMAGLTESVEEFSVAGEFPNGDYEITLEEAYEKLHEDNKVIGQLTGGERVQEQLVKLQWTDYFPLVYCGTSVGRYLIFDDVSEIDWDDGQNDIRLFVGAELTLFSGLKRLRKIRQAKEDLHSFRLTKEQTVDGLELGVRDAWERVQIGREQLNSARALVALAEKGYALAKKSYEVGQITLTEMQQRELDLNGARIALNAAQFEFHSAVLDLQLLMGAVALDG